jgi:cell division protein FtsL
VKLFGRTVTFIILAGFAAVVTAATAQVSLRNRLIRTGYEIGDRMAEIGRLEEENRKLRLEQSFLRSPERIERLARDKLGLVRPDPERIRVVRVPGKELARATAP